MGNNSIKVHVDCPNFNGDEQDKLEFKIGLNQFECIVNSRPSWTEDFKVSFLKSKVRKTAANFIHHLETVSLVFMMIVLSLLKSSIYTSLLL